MKEHPLSRNADTLRNLRIADLELFISAAHLKSLGQASKLHHLSQSAASSAIQRVEAAFGIALCMHEKRLFRLTKEGQLLLPKAEKWLELLREMVLTKERSPIRLVTTHAIARVCIPSILPIESVELKLMRPDRAYGSVLRDEADVAIVLDNALWEGLIAVEIGTGFFQLYSREKEARAGAVLLPEDQIEVLALQQRWLVHFGTALHIKARIPSWSLIADICANSAEIGFLPDFLGLQAGLHAISAQPTPSKYRILALYQRTGESFQKRLDVLIAEWQKSFGTRKV
jgi:DNA-binding transcriptional LysR family regulator